MQDIKLRMIAFPDQVNKILQIVKHGSAQEVKLLAPVPLGIITRKSQESYEAAKETQQKFENATLLLDEVAEASAFSKVRRANLLYELVVKQRHFQR